MLQLSKRLALAAFLVLLPGLALGQVVVVAPTQTSAIPVTASSGNVAAATATATIAAVTDKTNFLCGFAATGGGATAGATVNVTVTGLLDGTMTFNFGVPTGADLNAAPLVVPFPACAKGVLGTAIVVSMPTLGAGNVHASVNAWGFRY